MIFFNEIMDFNEYQLARQPCIDISLPQHANTAFICEKQFLVTPPRADRSLANDSTTYLVAKSTDTTNAQR